jgi:septal ring factor EnvC (AmiA/AmiB activator)
MIRAFPAVVIVGALAGFAAAPASAASPKDQLNQVESELGQHKQEAAALDAKAQAASENLKDLRGKLIDATEALQAKQEQQENLQEKLDALARDIDARNTDLAYGRKKLDALMESFIELSRQPPESLFLHTQLTSDHIHRAILLRTLVPKLKDQASVITGNIVELDSERRQMTEQKHLVAQAEVNMEAQRRNLDQLIDARQGMLDRTQEQKEAIARKLAALTSEAQNLHELLEEVTPKRGAASNTVPHALRGSLKWPVAGKVLRGFGTQDADGVKSEGLTFSAPSGSPVVAPASGKVVFAGPFRGYGQILILQHDGGYHSFLAGFGRIDAEMGQEVEAGEPLGVLPVKENGRSELYFEWRHNSEPVDPGVGGRR